MANRGVPKLAYYQEIVAEGSDCIYNGYMDVYSMLDGQGFVWDSDKAASNALRHGIRFEQAREVFLDQLARYEDANPQEEARQACIGLTTDIDCCTSSM